MQYFNQKKLVKKGEIKSVIPLLAALCAFFPQPVFAKYHKKQDADYVREWCTKNGGIEQKKLENGLRPDCTTSDYVVEVDSVIEWEKNLEQAIGYGISSGKKAKFVAVIEEPYQESFFHAAKLKIKSKSLPVTIEKLENFSSKEESLRSIAGPTVKMSSSGKCHVKGCGSYGKTTKNVRDFSSLAECLNAGGVLPRDISEPKIWLCEEKVLGRTSRNELKNTKKIEKSITLDKTSPNVKLSISGNKCHEKGSRYYNQTKMFLPFKTLQDCQEYTVRK